MAARPLPGKGSSACAAAAAGRAAGARHPRAAARAAAWHLPRCPCRARAGTAARRRARDREPALAFPCNRRERAGAPVLDDLAPVDAQARAVVLDQRPAAAGGELLQHLDELRFARSAQPPCTAEIRAAAPAPGFAARELPRRPREALPPSGKLLLEQRADPPPDKVARQRLVGVALVLDPSSRGGAHTPRSPCATFRAKVAAKSSPEIGSCKHAARPAQPRAAQQVHQHRFGLVVEVVRERDAVGAGIFTSKDLVARLAGRGLEALASLHHLHLFDGERHAEALAQPPAEGGPGVRVRAQTVMNVNGFQQRRCAAARSFSM